MPPILARKAADEAVKSLRQFALLRITREQIITPDFGQQGRGIDQRASVALRTPGFTSWTKIDSTNHAAMATIRNTQQQPHANAHQ
jgi:hypothetical protein